jgi:hypothetical protein
MATTTQKYSGEAWRETMRPLMPDLAKTLPVTAA